MDEKRTDVESSRRDFLKTATTVAGALVTGAAVTAEAEAAQGAAKPAAPAGGAKTAGKPQIPVSTIDAKAMTGGKFPMGTKLATGRAIGANDRITLGFVGVGTQGYNAHLRSYADKMQEWNVAPVAVCDPFDLYNTRAVDYIKTKNGGAPVLANRDYRKIIERSDIDAIVIATPEHWHGQIAVHAMQAGKHIYCEKPMTRYLDEAFQVYDVVKATKRVYQVGSQGCTDVRWHATAKAIREGKVGKLVMGQSSYTRNNRFGEWNYKIEKEISPETFDWELWLGSAPKRAWNFLGPAEVNIQPERADSGALFRRYRKYWDYSSGILSDLAPHRLHPFLIASGNPEFPTRVSSIGTHGVQNKDRDVADTSQIIAEFPSGWSMLFIGSTVNEQGLEDMFRGEKATVYFGNGVEVRPERPWTEEIEGEKIDTSAADLARFSRTENIPDHQKNWLESIRKNDPANCNANADLAIKVQTIISLAEMSQRLGKTMNFDPKTRKVTG
ncbi:Gfo/Idh/MocA family protein [Armatimonas rosea]|uniref:Glycosyl hydrolase family 109 protein n=1 Tax=Armatimonas rosea TaxID=685828 RepID=A0A7W9SQI4_ARMRO|nr:Gfo/Idh/MocA family oxidoreductase [Armatimonas rosea]MBB6050348.1 putative dehydrogenase [Armatimonas rosea]